MDPDLSAYPILRIDQLIYIDVNTLRQSEYDVEELIISLETDLEQASFQLYLRKQLEAVRRELTQRAANERINNLLKGQGDSLIDEIQRVDSSSGNRKHSDNKALLSSRSDTSVSRSSAEEYRYPIYPGGRSENPHRTILNSQFTPIPLPSEMLENQKANSPLQQPKLKSNRKPSTLGISENSDIQQINQNHPRAQNPLGDITIEDHQQASEGDAGSDEQNHDDPSVTSSDSRQSMALKRPQSDKPSRRRSQEAVINSNFSSTFIVAGIEKKKRFYAKKVIQESEEEIREKERLARRKVAMARLLERRQEREKKQEVLKLRRLRRKEEDLKASRASQALTTTPVVTGTGSGSGSGTPRITGVQQLLPDIPTSESESISGGDSDDESYSTGGEGEEGAARKGLSGSKASSSLRPSIAKAIVIVGEDDAEKPMDPSSDLETGAPDITVVVTGTSNERTEGRLAGDKHNHETPRPSHAAEGNGVQSVDSGIATSSSNIVNDVESNTLIINSANVTQTLHARVDGLENEVNHQDNVSKRTLDENQPSEMSSDGSRGSVACGNTAETLDSHILSEDQRITSDIYFGGGGEVHSDEGPGASRQIQLDKEGVEGRGTCANYEESHDALELEETRSHRTGGAGAGAGLSEASTVFEKDGGGDLSTNITFGTVLGGYEDDDDDDDDFITPDGVLPDLTAQQDPDVEEDITEDVSDAPFGTGDAKRKGEGLVGHRDKWSVARRPSSKGTTIVVGGRGRAVDRGGDSHLRRHPDPSSSSSSKTILKRGKKPVRNSDFKLTSIYEHIGMIFPICYNRLNSRQSEKLSSKISAIIESMQFQMKLYEEWLSVMADYATVFSTENVHGNMTRANQINDDMKSSSIYSGTSKALHFRVKSSRSDVCNIVTDVFRAYLKDWEELPSGLGLGMSWNLLWSWGRPRINRAHLLVWQRVNHFEESRQLTRKDFLKTNLQRYTAMNNKAASAFEIMPQTFLLPHEYTTFVKAFLEGADQAKGFQSEGTIIGNNNKDDEKNMNVINSKCNLWIMKPVGLSRGRGISLVSDLNAVTYAHTSVIQKYIERPLCLAGFKFDLRLFILVTSFRPLEAFIYKDGFARLSTQTYSLSTENLSNKFIHLTNSSIQKMNMEGPSADCPLMGDNQDMGGSKISLQGQYGLWSRLQSFGIDSNKLWNDICILIVKSLVVVDDKISYQPCAFEIFGYDVLIDENLRPWLIEVNASPSLARENALDIRVKNAMLRDTILLLNPAPYDRTAVARVLTRRLKELSQNKPFFAKNDEALESDLYSILGDYRPRVYGELPQCMGEFERLGPETKMFNYVMKLKNKIFKQSSLEDT